MQTMLDKLEYEMQLAGMSVVSQEITEAMSNVSWRPVANPQRP